MEHAKTQVWVKAASVAIIGFGLLVAAAAWPPLAGPLTLLVDVLIWPVDGLPADGGAEARLLSAIAGGVTVGWGVTLWKLAEHVIPLDVAAARSIAMTGIYIWFVVDSIGSITAGVPLNAVANVSFVVLFLFAFRPRRRA